MKGISYEGVSVLLLIGCYLIFNIIMEQSYPCQMLTAVTWNMRCNFSSAQPYLNSVLVKSDIIVLNEHGHRTKEISTINLSLSFCR